MTNLQKMIFKLRHYQNFHKKIGYNLGLDLNRLVMNITALVLYALPRPLFCSSRWLFCLQEKQL